MESLWTNKRQVASTFGALSTADAFDVARRFATDQSPQMREFRLQIARRVADIRDWQGRTRRRQVESGGSISLFQLLDEPEPPQIEEMVATAARLAGLNARGYEEMKRAAWALLDTIRVSQPGEFAEEHDFLEAFGMTGLLREERQLDIVALPEGATGGVDEDGGRTIIIEQSRDNIRWKLVDLYVVSVLTGEVERREGIPVPKRNDKDDRTRWYIPALSKEVTDADSGGGYVAFVTLGQTIDYLESWTNRQRKRITAAYKWMATNAGREPERERRLG
jgi:hypothetical protein